MNLVLGFAITLAVAAVAITAMLLVRRRAPEGSYFTDGDRASGVFGVIATGFSVLLGFIVFLAFTSYDQSRSGAESEARLVVQQVETAQFFPGSVSGTLTDSSCATGASSSMGSGHRCAGRRSETSPIPGCGDVPDAEVGSATVEQ